MQKTTTERAMNGKIFSEDNLRFAIFLLALWGSLWNFSSGINQRIDRLAVKIDKIDERLDAFGERITANKTRLDALE